MGHYHRALAAFASAILGLVPLAAINADTKPVTAAPPADGVAKAPAGR